LPGIRGEPVRARAFGAPALRAGMPPIPLSAAHRRRADRRG
jgi:hypothetical protein